MWSTIFNAPLEEMVKKFLLVIPNIAAAIAVLVIGYIHRPHHQGGCGQIPGGPV